ncbi:MAG: hypothetical protein K9N51_00995, partial [Candidatus Pacebacteria bacterium]|nr:hypothetical protein [Candidatus Paceibacterota bacterium]
IAPARTRPLEAKDVENEFHKALNDRILPVRVAGRVEGRLFVQERTLRKARQAFWEWAAERLQADHGVSAGERGIRCFEEMYSRTVEGPPVEHCITVRVAGARANPRQGARTTRALNEPKLEDGDEVVLPDFCGEGGLAEVRRHISECYNAGIRRFRVTSLWNLPLLSDYKDIAVTASFPLPVANSLAFEELRSLNVDRAAAWVELDRAALDDLVKRLSGAVEVFAYGRIPILTTRAYLPAKGRVTDARGNGFTIAVEGELTRLYPDKVMRLPVPKGAHEYIDLTHADPGEQETSNVNIDRSWA